MIKKPITLVKIGGSLITDKNKPNTVRKQALETIAREVKKAVELGEPLIIGHGGGSFPHFPAKKYQTHRGIINDQSLEGIAEVSAAAQRLNKIVMQALRDEGVLAVSIGPMSMMTAKNHQLGSIATRSIELLLEHGMLPVLYGDQVMDSEIGCTIFSTEKVLAFTALELQKQGYSMKQIIHCGQTNGVYDVAGNTIEQITKENFTKYKAVLTGSGGVDVTGGMLHKVEEALGLAEEGIPGLIIDGIEHGSLSAAIAGQEVIGTKILAK